MRRLQAYSLLLSTAAFLFALVFVCSGCSPSGDGDRPAQQKASAQTEPVFHDAAFGVLGSELLRRAGGSDTLKGIRRTGLFEVALDCNRPGMCSRNEYGVPRGFEIGLLRQAASFLGAKLNVVAPGSDAHLSGPFPPQTGPGADTTSPYFYSSKTGWLCFRAEGDPAFAAAFDLMVRHLYETGTYQQLYKNHFPAKDSGPR